MCRKPILNTVLKLDALLRNKTRGRATPSPPARRNSSILSQSTTTPTTGWSGNPILVHFGNATHCLSLASTISFAYAVYREFNNNNEDDNNNNNDGKHINSNQHQVWGLFDEEWMKEGFCVTNPNIDYWSSHDVCFYVDLVAVIFLGLTLFIFRKTRGMRRTNQVLACHVLFLLAHGIGHAFLARALRNNNGTTTTTTSVEDVAVITGSSLLDEKGVIIAALLQLPLLLFWYGIIRSLLPVVSQTEVGVFAMTIFMAHLSIPVQHGFSFIQTLVTVLFSLHQLARSSREKDFAFGTYPLLVSLPTSLMVWMESTQCSDLVRDKFYGHVLVGSTIVLCLFLWYVLCFLHMSGSASTARSLKKVKFEEQ